MVVCTDMEHNAPSVLIVSF